MPKNKVIEDINLVMILAVILLVLLVQALQTIGTKIAVKTNKKLRKQKNPDTNQ